MRNTSKPGFSVKILTKILDYMVIFKINAIILTDFLPNHLPNSAFILGSSDYTLRASQSSGGSLVYFLAHSQFKRRAIGP